MTLKEFINCMSLDLEAFEEFNEGTFISLKLHNYDDYNFDDWVDKFLNFINYQHKG